LNVRESTLEISRGLLVTVRVETNVCGELPAAGEATVTVSLYVPGPRVGSTDGFTVSARDCGVAPVGGATDRKLGPPEVVGATPTENAKAVLELVI